ncbi:UvrABC system protein C [Ferrovum sp. JA12]|uniref:excinuclease ABC subunit UvrC n=1 Tax=Ferrovum sp. JA12 TaxID=1356299 RepID=UPI0007026E7C|nr:excinuclease ABC subunit UvrC [Ferrovum sp. JA12]KRH78724.1 UvrABC system protein C [Ferrovum sp. JA12]
MSTFDLENFIRTLPNLPGVYRMFNQHNEVIYVGKAKSLKKRVSSYFQKTQLPTRTAAMVSHIHHVEITITSSESEALLLEGNLIKQLSPKYNVLFKDDKSYPYIQITQHAFPQIKLYRGQGNNRDNFYGPYPNSWAAREVIQYLQKLFLLRTCDESVYNHRSRPCLLHQIKRCSAPCVSHISQSDYQLHINNAVSFLTGHEDSVLNDLRHQMNHHSDQLEFEKAALLRDQIALMQQVLLKQSVSKSSKDNIDIIAVAQNDYFYTVNWVMIRGGKHIGDKSFYPSNTDQVSVGDIYEAFLSQHYVDEYIPEAIVVNHLEDTDHLSDWLTEVAGHPVKVISHPVGEKKIWWNNAYKNAEFALLNRLNHLSTAEHRLQSLQEALNLDFTPQRIECFDISHTQGHDTVASCVVFEHGAPAKQFYRKFNISGITPGDDYAAMSQALDRRYSRIIKEQGQIPDLLIIDGGKGQLNIAKEVLATLNLTDLFVVGVAKGEGRKAGLEKIILPFDNTELLLKQDLPGFHLIQAVRDEAHRFAITGHRLRRSKTTQQSVLDEIEGVGPKRRKQLLIQFGGLKGLQSASVDDIVAVPGIGLELAKKIYNHLH